MTQKFNNESIPKLRLKQELTDFPISKQIRVDVLGAVFFVDAEVSKERRVHRFCVFEQDLAVSGEEVIPRNLGL